MTDLESPKKNNDCYFYYYSTCAKGDNCTFRHEPSALGCETMCSFWKEGKCLNVHCNFRHMELRKNRKVIPCYWESQPVGCLKAHCPFLHQNPRPNEAISPEKPNMNAEKSPSDAMLTEQMNQSNERKVTAVDSLVVNFEEESDGETGPTFSPAKNRLVRVKTLEEIRLEKIQAESAAYYSYHGQSLPLATSEDGDDLRQRIVRRIISKQHPQERSVTFKSNPNEWNKPYNKRLNDDELATILGDESLRKKQKVVHYNDDGTFQVTLNKKFPVRNAPTISQDESQFNKVRRPTTLPQKQEQVENIKIKTLAEIRAERNAKIESEVGTSLRRLAPNEEEAEVSSTSMDENIQNAVNINVSIPLSEDTNRTRRKIKLRRKLPVSEESIVSSNIKEEIISNPSEDRLNTSESMDTSFEDDLNISDKNKVKTEQKDNLDSRSIEKNYLNKSEDDVLLSEDDDDYENVSLRAEEELLDEIDSLLED